MGTTNANLTSNVCYGVPLFLYVILGRSIKF